MHESADARFAPLVELPQRRLFGFALHRPGPGPNVLTCALEVASRWPQTVAPSVLVDVTAADLAAEPIDAFLARLRGRGVRAETLIVRVARFDETADSPALERLAEAGVLIAVRELDVAGADLGRYAGAPIDVLELPPAIVAELDRDASAVDAARGLVHLAHRHDWMVLASAVERAAQLAVLERIDCDLVSGPVAGRWMALDELDRVVARHGKSTA